MGALAASIASHVPSGLVSAGLSLASPGEIIRRASRLEDELKELLRVHGGGGRAGGEQKQGGAAVVEQNKERFCAPTSGSRPRCSTTAPSTSTSPTSASQFVLLVSSFEESPRAKATRDSSKITTGQVISLQLCSPVKQSKHNRSRFVRP